MAVPKPGLHVHIRKDRRTCLRRYFKEDFKTQHISCRYFLLKINTCDHYNDVGTRPYLESLFAKHMQTHACDPHNPYGEQAIEWKDSFQSPAAGDRRRPKLLRILRHHGTKLYSISFVA